MFKLSKFKIINKINPALGIEELIDKLSTANVIKEYIEFPDSSELDGEITYAKRVFDIIDMFNIKSEEIKNTSSSSRNPGKYLIDASKALIFEPVEPSNEIQVTSSFPLISAQGFYDANNLANPWVLPMISFKPENELDVDEETYIHRRGTTTTR